MTSARSRALAVDDINGDGWIDLVASGYHPTQGHFVALLGNGDGTFQLGPAHAGGSPGALDTGDFNGDGHPDFAAANTASDNNTVAVWIGTGDGSFQPGPTLLVNQTPASVQAADLDADGILDLAVASDDEPSYGAGDGLNVLLGRGDATFKPAAGYAAGANPVAVAIYDFTGDGVPDIVAANSVGTNSTVTLLPAEGGGEFVAAPTYAAGIEPADLAAADFNGDGDIDFAVASDERYGAISVILGESGGGFGTPAAYEAGKFPSSAATADFDGDGQTDVAVAVFNEFGATGHVSIVPGNGDGTLFAGAPEYPAGDEAQAVAIGDFNSDGQLDLAIAAYTNMGKVSVLLGNGDGAFQAPITYSTGSNANAVAVGEFNGDGVLDLVTPYRLLLGNGDGTFQTAALHGGSGQGVAVGDFNADGFQDLVSAGSSAFVKVMLGNGDGTFKPQVTYPTASSTPSVAVGDFDNDGIQDLVTANKGTTTIGVLVGNGDGTFRPAVSQSAGSSGSPNDVEIGDFNGDGNQDVAVVFDSLNGRVAVLLGNGDATFQPAVPYATGTSHRGTVADLDGDGDDDIVVAAGVAGSSGTFPSVTVLRGNGDGTFQFMEKYVAGFDPQDVAVGDFDGDGRMDLVVPNVNDTSYPAPGTVAVVLGTADGFAAVRAFPAGPSPISLVVGDLNGDGMPDIAVVNYPDNNSSSPGSVTVLLGTGDGVFVDGGSVTVGFFPVGIAMADFTADGFADLAVSNYGKNGAGTTVSILIGAGDGTFVSSVEYAAGNAPLALAVGDFNADGQSDLAVANALTAGTVSLLLGNGDGSFQPPQSLAVGARPQAVIVDDFNSDGIADLATGNYTGGTVTVLLGTVDSTFDTQSYAVGNFPVSLASGDFDGDGDADLAVVNFTGVVVLTNAGDWTPMPSISPERSSNAENVKFGDYNGDGHTELIASDEQVGGDERCRQVQMACWPTGGVWKEKHPSDSGGLQPTNVRPSTKLVNRVIRAVAVRGDMLEDDMIMNWNL